jgi:multiple antibiotic resistance protein
MIDEIAAGLKILVALFVVIDPIGNIPLFLVYLRNFSIKERQGIIRTAFIAALAVLILAQYVGDQMLSFFGIGVPSFQVAGGILIFFMALDMMNARPTRAKSTPEEESEQTGKHEIAVVPLAIPLVAGPGAISAVILFASQGDSALRQGKLSLVIIATLFLCWVVLALSSTIEKLIGRAGINVMSRLMGLISAAVAIEYIAAGIRGLFDL